MENELISKETEDRMIHDLGRIIDSKSKGKIYLRDYVDNPDACMDFAMLYESSDELQYFIREQRIKGVRIEIGEDSMDIIGTNIGHSRN